ncbi:MAG TPA: hypothetical protein VMZ22_05295 [Acidimicrobiales bacterium]|nr:hypothetical protein [Acidimicrobiales bacterium]
MTTRWRSTPAVAWTQAEGPGLPPRVTAWPWFATAATLAVAFLVILTSDSLCPEHKVWIDVLCTSALVLTISAITGLVRGWSTAPFLALGASALGVAIGVLDAAHSPLRGGLVVAGFVVAQTFGAWLSARQLRLLAWDKKLRDESAFGTEPASPGVSPQPMSTPAPTKVHDR